MKGEIIMYLDYSKIITNDLKLYIASEKVNELKEIAKKEKTYLINEKGETFYIIGGKLEKE